MLYIFLGLANSNAKATLSNDDTNFRTVHVSEETKLIFDSLYINIAHIMKFIGLTSFETISVSLNFVVFREFAFKTNYCVSSLSLVIYDQSPVLPLLRLITNNGMCETTNKNGLYVMLPLLVYTVIHSRKAYLKANLYIFHLISLENAASIFTNHSCYSSGNASQFFARISPESTLGISDVQRSR